MAVASIDRSRLARTRVADAAVDAVLTDAEDKLRDGQRQGFAGTDVTVTLPDGMPQAVAHRLGRKPRGWMVLDATGVAPQLVRTAWDAKTVTLQHGIGGLVLGATTVTLRFF